MKGPAARGPADEPRRWSARGSALFAVGMSGQGQHDFRPGSGAGGWTTPGRPIGAGPVRWLLAEAASGPRSCRQPRRPTGYWIIAEYGLGLRRVGDPQTIQGTPAGAQRAPARGIPGEDREHRAAPAAKRPPGPPEQSGRPCFGTSRGRPEQEETVVTRWPRWTMEEEIGSGGGRGSGRKDEHERRGARDRARPASTETPDPPPTRAIARRSRRAARWAVLSALRRRRSRKLSGGNPGPGGPRPAPRPVARSPAVPAGTWSPTQVVRQGYARYATPVGPAPGAGPGYHATMLTPESAGGGIRDSRAGAAVTTAPGAASGLGDLRRRISPLARRPHRPGRPPSDSVTSRRGHRCGRAGCAPAPGLALHRASCGEKRAAAGRPDAGRATAGGRRTPGPSRRQAPVPIRRSARTAPPTLRPPSRRLYRHITRIHARGATVLWTRDLFPVRGDSATPPSRTGHRACRRRARAPRRAGRCGAAGSCAQRRLDLPTTGGDHHRCPASRRRPRLVLQVAGPAVPPRRPARSTAPRRWPRITTVPDVASDGAAWMRGADERLKVATLFTACRSDRGRASPATGRPAGSQPLSEGADQGCHHADEGDSPDPGAARAWPGARPGAPTAV